MKQLISNAVRRFVLFSSANCLPEAGNTEVIAQTRILTLKGREPATAGVTSGAVHMSNQYSTITKAPGIRRQAARVAAIFGAIALIAALSMPTPGTPNGRVSADHVPLEAIFGTVIEVTLPDTITVATDSGVKTIVVTGDDVFTGDITAVEDISEGDRIAGSVHVDIDGTTTADRLLVVPDLTKSITRHILGVILDLQDGVIEIQDQDGNTITVDVPEGVEVPSIGTVVTAVAQLDRATGRLLAQAFDRVEDAVQRIREATDRVTDADLKAELEERLERARDQHLSALEKAREALDRARLAVEAAIAEREEAQRRLTEIQAKFDDLRQRYVQEASDRNERLPELRTEGTLSYDEDAWLEPSGTFSLTPRINDSNASVSRDFAWNEGTLAIVPVEIRESDPSSPAITVTTAQSIALPLNDVKSLIPSGSKVLVQYDPNTDPALATLITVLPPELPAAIRDALERERLRSVTGFITLVEETPDLEAVTGVVVVTNNEHDVKIAAKVTEDTEIEVDGEEAGIGQLAAGMSVEIEFVESQSSAAGDSGSSIAGRLDALRIRASSVVADNEVHVAGLVAGLDPGTRTVGILTRDGDIVRARVVDDAVIVKDGSPGRFVALEVGDLVLDATRFNRETLVLTRLVVQSPRTIMFSGAITGLDRNPERLTIATADGRVLVVFITPSSKLQTANGDDLTFSDLSVGNRIVTGEALPVQRDGGTLLVASSLVIGRSDIANARGVVRRVSTGTGQLSIEIPGLQSADTVLGSDLSTTITLSIAENNRSVLSKNDERIKTLATVEPGDIVESVSYVAATGIIVKMSVVSPNLQRVRGVVNTVTATGVVIETSNDQTVGLAVVEATVMTLNGRRIESLSLVSKGDIVVEAIYISGADNLAGGVALRLTLINRLFLPGDSGSPANPDGTAAIAPSVETTISGVIEEISDDQWQISGRQFSITPETAFFGEHPQKGLVAKATLRARDDGEFVAISISVAGRPDTNPSTRPVEVQPVEPGDVPDDGDTSGLVRILGRVQSVSRTLEGTIVVVDGAKISLLSNTIVVGDPEVGVNALAVVRRTPSGVVVAASIIFTRPTNTPATGAGNGEGDGAAGGVSDSVFTTETITIERISGRVVIADGNIYLLKPLQFFGKRAGDTITLRVRKVEGDAITDELSLLDRLVLNGNPLYQELGASGTNPIFVTE